METEKHYFKVGAFMMAVLVLLASFLIVFGDGRDHQEHTRYAIYFDNSIGSLTRGAPVKMRGISVGQVNDMHFVGKNSDRIVVTVDINDNAPLRDDTVASISLMGITGSTYISLENTQPDGKPLEKPEGDHYPVIRAVPSNLQTALSTAPEVMEGISRMASQAQKLMSDKNIADLQALMDEAYATMAEATGALREFKMLARTLRDDPSLLLRKQAYDGYKPEQQGKQK